MAQFNYTGMMLIPKGKTQTTPANFKPIKLCNALYKILCKTV